MCNLLKLKKLCASLVTKKQNLLENTVGTVQGYPSSCGTRCVKRQNILHTIPSACMRFILTVRLTCVWEFWPVKLTKAL